jgi:uncharacterized protein YybS (DUF2232 family)
MPYRAIITAALQSAGLYAAGFLIPLIGQIAVLFVPVPIIVLFLREGRRAGYLALVLASGLAAALGWWQAAVILFFLSFGLMAIGLAEGMARRWKAEQAIFLGGAVPVAALLLVLSLLLLKSGRNPVAAAEEYLRGTINDARDVYAKLGLTEVVQTLALVTDRIVRTVVRLLPGILLSTSLLQATTCYGMARAIILRGDPASPLASQPTLAAWHAPDHLVWGLIGTLVLVAWGLMDPARTTAFYMGLNLVFPFALLYLVQGISVLEHVFRKARIPALWRSILHAVILALPVVVLIVPLGIVDIWADFRKVRKPAGA